MDKVIIFKKLDNAISIDYPAVNMSEDDLINHAEKLMIEHDYISYRISGKDDILIDRTFRNAWVDDGKINVDMEKARNIHINKIRESRNNKLKEVDIEYMKAEESGNQEKKQELAAKKQELRDLTSIFDLSSAKTPEELKQLWPDIIDKII